MTDRSDWKSLPKYPHWTEDFGYTDEDWVAVRSSTEDQLIFIPEDPSHLGKEEFIVIDTDSLQ